MVKHLWQITLVIFQIACTAAVAQNRQIMVKSDDSLLQFALRNEFFFRHQVSKFYPIPDDLLEKYSEDWQWSFLSENQTLCWDNNFIQKFSGKWDWAMLFRNPKIEWTEAKIDQLEENADWYYLSQNPSLPLSLDFLRKYEKRVNWYFLSQNPAFLQQPDLVETFKNRMVKADPRIGNKEKSDEKQWSFSKVERFLEGKELSLYDCDIPEIFQQLVQPTLSDALLAETMQKLNPSDVLRFFELTPTRDEFGLTQRVVLKDRKQYEDNPLGFPIELSDTFQLPDLVLYGYEPPLRFSPMHDWDIVLPHGIHVRFVSADVKSVLERFKLPPHRFYPFQLSYEDENFGSDSRQYFVLHLEKNDDPQLLEASDFDLVVDPTTRWMSDILVSEDVRKALEAAEIGKIGFRKIRQKNPVVRGANTPKHREKNAQIIESIRRERAARPLEPEQISIKNYKAKQQWQREVLAQKSLVENYRKANPAPSSKSKILDTLRQKELEFEVILPPSYLEKMCGSDRWRFRKYHVPECSYEILPASKIEQYNWKQQPFAAKSVIFAENGLGDGLGFLLKPNSIVELDDVVFEFLHETGDIRRIGKLE